MAAKRAPKNKPADNTVTFPGTATTNPPPAPPAGIFAPQDHRLLSVLTHCRRDLAKTLSKHEDRIKEDIDTIIADSAEKAKHFKISVSVDLNLDTGAVETVVGYSVKMSEKTVHLPNDGTPDMFEDDEKQEDDE